ncbi:MAG TPA: alpha/beta fold hydrolase, partial [Gemmatimonadaceae bacterium]|nr:alpha/beta fold hydrolase [Gemmatimonadaceae bacterium]
GRAPARPLDPAPTVAGVAEWPLPDGGHLAYLRVPAVDSVAPRAPLLVLHDGPGLPMLPQFSERRGHPYDTLAALGVDVYYYDQRGAGLSTRQDLVRDRPYSVAMHVADLESARVAIGAPRLMLAGTGWGATLALQYAIAYPKRVEALVLESPAALWPAEWPALLPATARARLTDVQASLYAASQQPPLRLVLGRMMADVSRPAAHQFIDDWEADQWWTQSLHASWRLGPPRFACGDLALDSGAATVPPGAPSTRGAGFFANSYTLADAAQLPDPRGALASLHVPTLVVRGACDFVDVRVREEYLAALPRASSVVIEGAGHHAWLSQPARFSAVVSDFVQALR